MHALGVDVGYGHTKAVSSLRDRPLTFPSVVGRAEAEVYRLDLNGHDRTGLRGGVLMCANDDAYLYGEPAIRTARVAHQPRDRDWIRSQPYRVLWDAVVTELLLPSTHPIIVTGLPVRYYSADRAVLEEVVQQVLQIRNIRPRLVIVVPQPFGSFFAHILDHTGRLAPERHPTAHRGIAEAIRCALYDHLQGQRASSSTDTPLQRFPSSIPPDPSPSAAREHATATKLRRMF